MPRSVSGNYTLPLPPVVPNTTIEATWANTTDDDIAQALTDSLDRYGRGGMVAPFRLVDGSESIPAWAFAAETGTGMWRDGAGNLSVSVQGAKVGEWSTLGYSGNFSGPVAFDGPITGPVTFTDAATFQSTVYVSGVFKAAANVALGKHVVIDPTGTPYPWGADFYSLDIGNVTGFANNVAAGYFQATINAYNDGTTWRSKAVAAATIMTQTVDGAVWARAANPGAANAALAFADVLSVGLSDGVVSLRKDTTSNLVGPVMAFNNRGTNAVAEYRRLGGISFGAYRDVQDPSFIAGIYGYNTQYPGTSAGIDFIVSVDNGGGPAPMVPGNYRVRMSSTQMISAVPVDAIGASGGSRESLFAFSPTSGGGLQVGALVAGSAGSAGQYIRAQRWTAAQSEPTVYRLDMEINNVSTPGFPIFAYDWVVNQYNGYNSNTCRIYGATGQWAFSVAISNPSMARLKSNWTYETGGLVDGLAAIADVGSFDMTVGDPSPAAVASPAIPPDVDPRFPLGRAAIVARPATPPVTVRQVGVTAEALRVVMPDAVHDNGDGVLSVTYGNAALVAAIALAKRVKAIEAFVGL